MNIEITFKATLPEEKIMDLARHYGYQGSDIGEAIELYIFPAFKNHVAPWMISAALVRDNFPKEQTVEIYKQALQGTYREVE